MLIKEILLITFILSAVLGPIIFLSSRETKPEIKEIEIKGIPCIVYKEREGIGLSCNYDDLYK